MDKNTNQTQSDKDKFVAENVPYVSATDACEPLGTVVPSSMAHEQKRFNEGLRKLSPSVHEYVMNRLNYTDYEEFCKSFGREQIDALANAIYNFENTGFGIIIADQTGVGKGRIAAGLIRYSIEYLKKMPIFVTDKAHLISDMYRDLIDINYQANVPEKVRTVSTEVEDFTENQILKIIAKDIDIDEDLRIPMESIFDGEVPDNALNIIQNAIKNKRSTESDTEDDYLETIRENLIEEYRKYILMNGLESYVSDWKLSKDGEFGLNGIKGDTYDSLLQKEIKKGRKVIKPFTTKSMDIKDEYGNLLYMSRYNKNVETTQKLDSTYKVFMTTYSQFSNAFDKNGAPTPKFELARKLALDGLLIFDESHKASGISAAGLTNTARAIVNLMDLASNVIYISATFAKRAENMFLYSRKTAIAESRLDFPSIISAFKSGGNALQEAVSAELTKVGHLIRRQRPIVGRTIYHYTDKLDTVGIEQQRVFDTFRGAMVELQNANREIRQIYRAYLKDMLGEQYKEKKDNYPYKGNTKQLTFNIVSTFLLGLKVDETVKKAIEYLSNGRKPVIAIANTLESIFDNIKKDYEQDVPYEIGDVVNDDLGKTIPYLIYYMFKFGIYREIKELNPETGQVETKRILDAHHFITDCPQSFMPLQSEMLAIYQELMNKYKDFTLGITLSPIDRIAEKIKKKGFSVGEVTGRTRKLKYENDIHRFAKIEKRAVANVTDTIRDFNYNVNDALILNRSGAVGVSMHSKPNDSVSGFDKKILKIDIQDREKFAPNDLKDKSLINQRVMIITQMELDVNNEVQKLGRISRTGQIYPPIYEYIFSCLPFEKRFASLMEKKMRSLMANVSSDQEGGSSQFSADDLISDEAGTAVLEAVQVFSTPIEIPEGLIEEPSALTVDYVLKNIYFKPIDEQEEFFDNFITNLKLKIDNMIADGTYNKKMLLKQYNAETEEVALFELGMENPFSSFGSPVVAEQLKIEVFEEKVYEEEIESRIAKYISSKGISPNLSGEDGAISKEKSKMKNFLQDVITRKRQDIERISDEKQILIDNIISLKALLNSDEAKKILESTELKSKIQELRETNAQLQSEIVLLFESTEQDASQKVANTTSMIQQNNQTIKALQEKYDSMQSIIDEYGEEVKGATSKISLFESQVERKDENINKVKDDIENQKKLAKLYSDYAEEIGYVFHVKITKEDTEYQNNEDGSFDYSSKKYVYSIAFEQPCVLTSIQYNGYDGTNIIQSAMVLTFSPAYGDTLNLALSKIHAPLTESELAQNRKNEVSLKSEYFYNKPPKWDNYVANVYSGRKDTRVFLTGSLLRAMAIAKENKLSGKIVKYNTINNSIRIGYELTKASSQLIMPRFNDVGTFPVVTELSSSINENVIMPHIQNTVTSLAVDEYCTGYLFELTEKTKTKIEGSVSTAEQFALIEFRPNLALRANAYDFKEKLTDAIKNNTLNNTDLMYVRISVTTFGMLLPFLEKLRNMGYAETSYASDFYNEPKTLRTVAYLTEKGDKPYTVPKKEKVYGFSFINNSMSWQDERALKQFYRRGYNVSINDTNRFFLTSSLTAETFNNVYWYDSMRFAIDMKLDLFNELCDALKQQGTPLKTVVSYAMIKDSGMFTFDIESHQKGLINTESDEGGFVEEQITDDEEKDISQLIDECVELFNF
jgi:hypothetical protein